MMRLLHTGSRLARVPRALLALGFVLSLLTGWCAVAVHHHDDCAPVAPSDACALCVVAKVAAAPPPAPVVLAAAGLPESIERSEPEAAPAAPRAWRHPERGPPRG